jgi:flagellar secretion chaperone FliS
MNHPARTEPNDYLVTEVMTASPQKLRLMLIEAALRHCQRVAQGWEQGQREVAAQSLIRAQEIVCELLSGTNKDADAALVRRTNGVYMFVFRQLGMAQLRNDSAKLADAARILELERETWRQVCAQLAASESPRGPHRPPNNVGAPASPHTRSWDAPSGGFSLHA